MQHIMNEAGLHSTHVLNQVGDLLMSLPDLLRIQQLNFCILSYPSIWHVLCYFPVS